MKTSYIIIFDGICNLCNATVLFLINRDKKNIFKFVSMQSDIAKQIFKEYNINFKNLDTIIFIEKNDFYIKSDAIIRIFKKLNYPWKVFYFLKFLPKFIRDRIYDIVANNRYNWFGRRNTCMIPSNETKSKFIE